MKVNLPTGLEEYGFTIPAMELTGPVSLSKDGIDPTEIIDKDYVDTKSSQLNSSVIQSGTLRSSIIPGFTGGVQSDNNTTAITLTPTGIEVGSYTRVTVNQKGLITNSVSLLNENMPYFGWGKITSGKPTTLAGYGITDGVLTDGGTVSGALVLSSDPTVNNQAATKAYTDTTMVPSPSNVTGDIVGKALTTEPTGFLRCDGREISQTLYNQLYNIVGDTYTFRMTPGSGQPWRQHYDINTEQSTDINNWKTGTSIPVALMNAVAVVTKNYAYLMGGKTSTAGLTTIYRAPINSDGTLGTWVTDTNTLATGVHTSRAIVTKNKIYLLGGYTTSNTVLTNIIQSATINTDGTIGAWSNSSTFPVVLARHQVAVTKDKVYVFGCQSSSAISTIYVANINSDGSLGTWSTPGNLPTGYSLHAAETIVTKNKVYLLGGMNGSNTLNSVLAAPIAADGTVGAWANETNLPGIARYSQSYVTRNRVYLFVGYNASAYVATVYTAPITNGTIGTWSTGTALPGGLGETSFIATKNRVYLLGGRNASAVLVSTVYTAPIYGGLNDYSPYYDGSFSPTASTHFRLPDLRSQEVNGLYYYIKT